MVDEIIRRTGSDPSLGMRTTRTWTEEELPKGYREGVNLLWPNGKATLTGLLSKVKKVRESQSHFMWFEKKKAVKNVAATTTSTTVVRGDNVNIGITTAFMNMVREGHEVVLRSSDNHDADVVAKVTNVSRTSTPSVDVMVVTPTGTLAACDRMNIVGNINSEASVRPASISYNAEERENYQQIWRNSLSMSRTDLKNVSRLKDRYKDLKAETWQDHAEEQEGCFLWGVKDQYQGDNGEPERITGGLIPEMKRYAPQNIFDCARQADFAGGTFAGSSGFGIELLEDYLIKTSFLWGEDSAKMVFIGNSVQGAIQKAVRDSSQYQITHGESQYGINVSVLTTPYGTWNLHRYTPFNLDPSLQHSMLAFSLDQMELHYTDDFHFEKDEHFGKGGGSGLDGLVEGFLTEAGLAFNHVEKAVYAYNFGMDSLLSAP